MFGFFFLGLSFYAVIWGVSLYWAGSGGIWTAFQTFNIKECRHLFLQYFTQTHAKAKAPSIWIGPWIIGPLRVIMFITQLPAKGIKNQHQISTHGYGKYCVFFLKNIFVSIFFFFSSLKVFQIHQTWVDILLGNQNSLFFPLNPWVCVNLLAWCSISVYNHSILNCLEPTFSNSW